MTAKEKVLEERKKIIRSKFDKIINNPYSLGIFAIFLFAAIIRLYFFFIAKTQTHWWDSLAFGSIAKNMVLGLWQNNPFLLSELVIRPPLLPILWAALIKLNFTDATSLLLLEIIPSIFSVLIIYLLAKELYNKRVALISAFILSVLWIHLFYSVRIMSDIPSLFFILASLYFFVRSYDNFNLKLFSISIFFISLAVLTRYFYGLIGAVYIWLIIIKYKHKFLKNKNFWFGGIIGATPILIFFAYNIIVYKGLLPAASVYSTSAAAKPAFAYYVLGFIQYDLQWIFTIFLAIGAIVALFELIVSYDAVNKIKRVSGHLLLFLVALFSLIFFIFILRAAEDRYLFLLMPSLIIFSSLGFDFAYQYLKKYNKIFAIFFIILLLLVGAYYNLSYAKSIIENKKTSYLQMKDAFLWIKTNTPSTALVAGDGIDPYLIYYSERVASHFNITSGSFDRNPDFIILHGFEHQTSELVNYVNSNQVKFVPVYVNYFDQTKQNPAVAIYQVSK